MLAACGLACVPPGGVAAAAPRPTRIFSANLCTDLLLLSLVPRDRIASITYLAPDAVRQVMPGADRGVRLNHGTAEEAAMQRPDLILAGPGATPMLRLLVRKVGAPLVEVPPAQNFADIRRITLSVGREVGEPARAAALVAAMDRILTRLAATRPARPVRLVAWNGGQSVPGRGTLADAIITAAGGDNIAAGSGQGAASFGIEELLAARPQAVLRGRGALESPSLHTASADHPLLDRAFRGRIIDYPDALYACGVPQSAMAAVQLRQALGQLPGGGR